MPKYIDIENFSQMVYENFGRDSEYNYRDLIRILKEQPIADVKEVVYCKDCKHRNTNECSMWIKCSECGSQWSWENNNDYCSYGERGDNGNE